MAISERDKLDAAEYFLDILDTAKADNKKEVPNGCGTYETAHGDWMDRARRLVRHRISQYMDNTTPRRFGPDDPNPKR